MNKKVQLIENQQVTLFRTFQRLWKNVEQLWNECVKRWKSTTYIPQNIHNFPHLNITIWVSTTYIFTQMYKGIAQILFNRCKKSVFDYMSLRVPTREQINRLVDKIEIDKYKKVYVYLKFPKLLIEN